MAAPNVELPSHCPVVNRWGRYLNLPRGQAIAFFALVMLLMVVLFFYNNPTPKRDDGSPYMLSGLIKKALLRIGTFSLSNGGVLPGFPDKELYKLVLPPSRQYTLPQILGCGGKRESSPEEILRRHIPLDKEVEDLREILYSPTGISTQNVNDLGRFPDYATLSGIRLPKPEDSFKIDHAVTRPYRPVRWPYHQTMAFNKLDPDYWIELDQNYATRVKQRQEIYVRHGKTILDHLPGSECACRELMEMVVQFLCARYPQYFQLVDDSLLLNKILGIETNLQLLHPLHVLLENVPEDFAIALRDPETGTYFLRAGIICSSLGWSLGTKIGQNIDEIHEPVPDYKEKMKFSMNRFFAKMSTEKAIQRGSWGIEIDQPLHMPPGDPLALNYEKQDLSVSLERYHLRVDWQTLRRLPLSGAVVFSFKALFTPVTHFRNEPYIPSLFLKNYLEGKPNLLRHKNIWHTEATIIPALRRWEQAQKNGGIIPRDWEVATLKEYPYYPGWQKD